MVKTSMNGLVLAQVVLIGTVHRDPEGCDKLLSVLRDEEPDYLTLEMSPYAIRYRSKKRLTLRKRLYDLLQDLTREVPGTAHEELLSHPAIRNVFAVVDFPYEYLAVSSFSRSRHVPFQCIDKSGHSRKKLARLEKDLVTSENLRALIHLNPREVCQEVNREYILASIGFSCHQKAAEPRRNPREPMTRDRHMASRIRALLHSTGLRKLVHVGGWEHLVDDGKRETLFTLLSDLRPRRLLLPRSRIRGPSSTSTLEPASSFRSIDTARTGLYRRGQPSGVSVKTITMGGERAS